MNSISSMPMANTPERALANVALYQLAAAALGHPLPELHQAFADGRFHKTFNSAWYSITGREWPQCRASTDFATLEAGYIDMFLHGRRGEPRVYLLAGDYDHLRDGVTRPVFMLNIQAFYRHFDLRAATADEGRNEEPDHIVTMLEFMAVLHHLEAQALSKGGDPGPYRRAQRDFLQRYLVPLMETLYQEVTAQPGVELDPNLLCLIENFPYRLQQQLGELEVRVGQSADPSVPVTEAPRTMAQNLWS